MSRHVATVGLLAAALVAACGGGSSDPGVTGATTQSTEVTATTTTVDTTETDTTGGVLVADTLVTPGLSPIHVLGHADQFVQLTTADGRMTVARSADGIDWEPVSTDLALEGISMAATDGTTLHVGGWPADGAVFVTATSDDDGATWTTTELPVTDPGLPYVQAQSTVTSLAAGDGTAVAAGMVNNEVDWRAYSMDTLGVDHGDVTGMGTADGTPGHVTVEFTDGFELTVDAAEFGLDAIFAGPGPQTVVWVFDGTAWDQLTPPIGFSSGQTPIAFGPAGYVALGPPATSQGGTSELRAFRSLDGRTWEDVAVPGPPSDDIASLAGGPLGYVIVHGDVLYHSPDAVTWTEVHRFENPAPGVLGFGSQYLPAAGPTGFLVPITQPDQPPLVLSSPDGLTWEQLTVPADADYAFVALDDRSGVVIPVVVDESLAMERADFPDDESLRAAIVENFTTPRALVTTDEATCIADGLLDEFGRQRLQELGFGVDPWHLLGYALAHGPFDRPDSERIVDTFRRCSPTWELLMITSVTEGTEEISVASATCVADAVADAEARDLFVLQLDRPEDEAAYPDPTPYVQTYQRCLTPEEFDRLDFD